MSDDYSHVEFGRHGQHTARKPWRCTSCQRSRPAGTTYRESVGKVDGEFYALKRCNGVEFGCCEFAPNWLVTLATPEPNLYPRQITFVVKADAPEDAYRGAEAANWLGSYKAVTAHPDGFPHRVDLRGRRGLDRMITGTMYRTWLDETGLEEDRDYVSVSVFFDEIWFKDQGKAALFKLFFDEGR